MRRINKEDVLGLEFVFATYAANTRIQSDALIIKEKIHLKDGTVIPNLRILTDKKWPFYVTRKGHRNHQDHKEYEDLSKLQRFESTRIKLPQAIAAATGQYTLNKSLRDIANWPYLYGLDILPTSQIKHAYQTKYKDIDSKGMTVAGLDIETDMVWGTEEVIITNIAMRGKAYTAVTEKFIRGHHNFIETTKELAKKLVPKDVENLDWEIEIVETPAIACIKVIEKAHQWSPDFISIWNMNFDIPKIIDTLLKEGYEPEQIFSDPRVPPEFRFYRYIEGPSIKVTHDGRKTSIHHADRWHVMNCPAGFYFLDSMCLRKKIRFASGNEPSYKLNEILAKEGLETKLSIKEVEALEGDGEAWHYTLQKDYKAEYTIYNLIDDIRLLDYDEKTGDISRVFNVLAGISDYSNYHKNPRRIADDLHYFYLERGKVVGSTPGNIADDPLNKHLLSLKNWIVTLPNYMINSGLSIIEDAPHLQTMFYQYLSD